MIKTKNLLPIFTIYLVLFQLYKVSTIFVVLPVVIMFYVLLQYSKTGHFKIKQTINQNSLLIWFVLLTIIAVFRSNKPNHDITYSIYVAVLLILFVLVYYTILNYSQKNGDLSQQNPGILINFLITPFFLLVITNWLLYFLNVTIAKSAFSGVTYPAVILSYLGVHSNRIEFPLVSGFNSYSIYIGGVLAVSLPILFFFNTTKRTIFVFCTIFLLTLLFTDSRASMLLPFLIFLLIKYLLKNKKRLSAKWWFLSTIIILGPIAYAMLLPLLAGIPGLEFLSRGDDDFATGNSRFFIWGVSLLEFINFKLIHLIGYGEIGHFGSGASKAWAFMFGNYEDSEIVASPHNTMFSILFDYGYIGLITYFAMIIQLINRIRFIWLSKPIIASSLLAFVLYNIFCGITESLAGIYLMNYMLLFSMITMIINFEYFNIKKSNLTLTN